MKKMTDIKIAVKNLPGHSICLVKDKKIIVVDGKGISPIMDLISSGADLHGYSAADVIVGKAAAMLFLKSGVCAVYGKIVSRAAVDILSSNGIPFKFETIVDHIINREGNDICPMEKAVWDIYDPEEAYLVLYERLKDLRQK